MATIKLGVGEQQRKCLGPLRRHPIIRPHARPERRVLFDSLSKYPCHCHARLREDSRLGCPVERSSTVGRIARLRSRARRPEPLRPLGWARSAVPTRSRERNQRVQHIVQFVRVAHIGPGFFAAPARWPPDRVCPLLPAPIPAGCGASRPRAPAVLPAEHHRDKRRDSHSESRARTATAPAYPPRGNGCVPARMPLSRVPAVRRCPWPR